MPALIPGHHRGVRLAAAAAVMGSTVTVLAHALLAEPHTAFALAVVELLLLLGAAAWIGSLVSAKRPPTDGGPVEHESSKSKKSCLCATMAVDIVGFGNHKRDDQVQLYVRGALYDMLERAFDGSAIPWVSCYHEDRGDGALILIDPEISLAALFDPLITRLQVEVRHHNKMSSEAARIQLRIALHAGYVHADANGLAGTTLIHLFRLLDAPQFKQELAAAPIGLALIVSEFLYDAVLRDGLIDSSEYHPMYVDVRETRARAWVTLGNESSEASRAGRFQDRSRQWPGYDARSLGWVGRHLAAAMADSRINLPSRFR
jgi:hypothetical protein